VTTVGVELRRDLVAETNAIARGLGPGSAFDGLRFEEAAIADYVAAQASAASAIAAASSSAAAAAAAAAAATAASTKGAAARDHPDLLLPLEVLPPLEVLVALHACDTATDDALWAGLQSGAHVLVTAPCCHKQVRQQLDARVLPARGRLEEEGALPHHPLADVLRFGTLRERHAEMATDAVRLCCFVLFLRWLWSGFRCQSCTP
jgi:hypothetical protein